MTPIFYRPEQSTTAATGYSPSAGKPALAVEDWKKHFADKIEIRSDWEPLTAEEISRAHDPKHVADILAGRECNGFGNTSLEIAESLRYTTGSFVAAVKHVMQHGGIACSPTSGFHHARYAEAGGYCTFNGLILGALAAQDMGAKKVLILDGDAHYADGSDDVINQLGLADVKNVTAMKSYDSPSKLFYEFGRELKKQPDIVLFQAGADMHADDPLGGMLTTSEMEMRDSLVISECRLRGIPLVFNLAGGYQRDAGGNIEPVLKLHRYTIAIT